MDKVYTAISSDFNIWTVDSTLPTREYFPPKQANTHNVWTYDVYELAHVSTSDVQLLEPGIRSKDALPINHPAWLELEALFLELQNTALPDEFLDEDWLNDIRANADNRINEWYDSEDWQ